MITYNGALVDPSDMTRPQRVFCATLQRVWNERTPDDADKTLDYTVVFLWSRVIVVGIDDGATAVAYMTPQASDDHAAAAAVSAMDIIAAQY